MTVLYGDELTLRRFALWPVRKAYNMLYENHVSYIVFTIYIALVKSRNYRLYRSRYLCVGTLISKVIAGG